MGNVLIRRIATLVSVLLLVSSCQTEQEVTLAKVDLCSYDETRPVIQRALIYKDKKEKTKLLALRDSLFREENALSVEKAYLSYRVGQLYGNLEEHREAIGYYSDALERFWASDTIVYKRVIQMYFNLANEYFKLEARDSSNMFAHKGLDLIYSEGPCDVDERKAVYLYRTIGVNLREEGDYAGSFNYFEKGVEICRTSNPFYRYCAMLMDGYAYSFLETGRLEEAKKVIKEGEQYITNNEIINGTDSEILSDIYDTYFAIADQEGSLEDAEAEVRKGLEINLALRRQSSYAANSYNNLGRILIRRGRYENGEAYLRRALSLYRLNKQYTKQGTCYENFVKSASLQEDTLMALAFLDSAALAYHGYPEAPGIGNALDKQELKDPIFTRAELMSALHLSRPEDFPLNSVVESVARVDSIIGFLSYGLRSEVSKREAIAKLRALYDHLISFSYQQWQKTGDEKYKKLGITYLERAKSQILKERRRRTSNSTVAETAEQEKEVRKISGEISALKGQLRTTDDREVRRKTSEKINRQELRWRNLQEEIYSMKTSVYEYDGQFSNLKEMSSKLEEDEVVLDYFLGDEKAYVAVVTKGKVEMESLLLHPDSIAGMVDGLMDCFNARIDSLWEYQRWRKEMEDKRLDLSYRLYEGLVKSPLPNPEDFKRLTIIPDGVLAILPFSALLTEPAPKGGAATGEEVSYLVTAHAVNYEFSAGIWRDRLKSPYSGGAKALVVAPLQEKRREIEMPASGKQVPFGPLSYVDQEVAAVKDNIKSKVMLGPDACELADKSSFSNYGVLHFSGHGEVFPDDISQSFLLLDLPTDGDPCLLRLPDLEAKKMNVDLLVLSACETGTGELAQEEGIISLSRAGAIAGAQSVVSSLWLVNQETKAELFRLFYKHLAEGDRRDEALRASQRYFLESGERSAHPYYWAGFLNTGSGEVVQADYR